MLLRLIEIFAVFAIIAFIVMQIAIPWVSCKPMFPFFRKKVELELELKEIQEDQEVADLEARVNAARGELQKKRKTIRPRVNR